MEQESNADHKWTGRTTFAVSTRLAHIVSYIETNFDVVHSQQRHNLGTMTTVPLTCLNFREWLLNERWTDIPELSDGQDLQDKGGSSGKSGG